MDRLGLRQGAMDRRTRVVQYRLCYGLGVPHLSELVSPDVLL